MSRPMSRGPSPASMGADGATYDRSHGFGPLWERSWGLWDRHSDGYRAAYRRTWNALENDTTTSNDEKKDGGQ